MGVLNIKGGITMEQLSTNNFNNIILNNDKLAIKQIIDLNELTNKRNLILTEKQAISLINNRDNNLKELGRIEVGSGILDKIIYEFYDSPYIDNDNYLETLEAITDVFYFYQSELDHKLTDEQILKYIKKQFDGDCAGSIELLENKSLDNLKNNKGQFYE